MACIPGRDTRPERLALAAVRPVHDGPITTQAALPGTPHIALPELRVVINALGCSWHDHDGWPSAHLPATAYPWAATFARTKARAGAA